MFRELTGDVAVLVEMGVYKICPLYEYSGYLFAKYQGGYVKLYENKGTSKSNGKLMIDSIHLDISTPVYKDAVGRLMLAEPPDKKLAQIPDKARHNHQLTGPK